MLLNALSEQRLVEIASLLQAIGAAKLSATRPCRASRQGLAALQARLLVLKCSLGLYLNQTSPAAIQRELQRRGLLGAVQPVRPVKLAGRPDRQARAAGALQRLPGQGTSG